ncbi:cecropin-A-like isoform X1 [Aethina tumida]|uniref:cecropin-A-like isoform X1 n=1 Tax=Aethina tumida TaxID=116153 RepID=UPI0021493495|nr:cecropin-A-like isoform X1 [Aethina tumida]
MKLQVVVFAAVFLLFALEVGEARPGWLKKMFKPVFEYKTTKMKLGFVIIFTILIVSAFFGSTEAGWLKKKLKKVEKAGQRVRDAAEKALPIVSGYAPIIATAGR